jgi:SAM-dependent methyltransferase
MFMLIAMFKKYKYEFVLDDYQMSLAHWDIIRNNQFLKRLYLKWYEEFKQNALTVNKGKYLELGSGGGFLKKVFPEVITSDVLNLPHVDKQINAEILPFSDEELGCIMMLNVFHHIPRPYLFLKEAERTLVNGGKIIMTEPANSVFGRFIYKNFHHEPFDENGGHEIDKGNANQALAYIFFERDVKWFNSGFPALHISKIQYHTPLLYLISGGVSRTAMLPSYTYNAVSGFEKCLSPFNKFSGLFCTIEIEKRLR